MDIGRNTKATRQDRTRSFPMAGRDRQNQELKKIHYDSNGKFLRQNGAIHRVCDMPLIMRTALGCQKILRYIVREIINGVFHGNRGNRGYSFLLSCSSAYSLVIHPLISTDMAKRRRQWSNNADATRVGSIFEYMVETYLNGNMSVFRGLYHELNRDARKDFIDFLLSELKTDYWEDDFETPI